MWKNAHPDSGAECAVTGLLLPFALVLSGNTVGPVAHASSTSKFTGRQTARKRHTQASWLADELKKGGKDRRWVLPSEWISALSSPPSSSGSNHSAIAVVIIDGETDGLILALHFQVAKASCVWWWFTDSTVQRQVSLVSGPFSINAPPFPTPHTLHHYPLTITSWNSLMRERWQAYKHEVYMFFKLLGPVCHSPTSGPLLGWCSCPHALPSVRRVLWPCILLFFFDTRRAWKN
jgi:hypothetical protein